MQDLKILDFFNTFKHTLIKMELKIYRVSQKFVPLISCTITFDQNFIFTWNFSKMFISLSSTCIQNFSNWHALFVFFITFCGRCGMKWDTACKPTWSWCAGASSTPTQHKFCLVYRQLKKIYFGHSSKKDNIILAPFHSKAFVLLYKFETSWAFKLAD